MFELTKEDIDYKVKHRLCLMNNQICVLTDNYEEKCRSCQDLYGPKDEFIRMGYVTPREKSNV